LTGTPLHQDIDFIQNINAKNYLKNMKYYPKTSLSKLFPDSSPLLLNLIDNMLVFNPNKRMSVKDCLEHEYFKDIYHYDDLVKSKTKFDWSFDNDLTSKSKLQLEVYSESL